MMNKIFSALVSFLITVVPVILALHQPSASLSDAEDWMGCGQLSVAQEAGLRAWFEMSSNATCVYNITIGSDGVIAY